MGISKLHKIGISKAPLELAREVLRIEAREVAALADRLDQSFVQAVDLILQCQGRIVVSGMGKSGHIGSKIASTFASTGTPAFFMHPGEASHGDLGMITQNDVVIALSNSGESDELIAIIPIIKRLGAKIISITGNAESLIAKESHIHLDASVSEEACPLGLAPTASSTAALALGDALAVTVLDLRGFSEEDFALSHPGGRLGKRLLVRVSDIMRKGDAIPKVQSNASLPEGLLEISRKGLGLTSVIDESGNLVGIFTDGDLRRSLEQKIDLSSTSMRDLMFKNPRTIHANQLAVDAVEMMELNKLNCLLVLDENQQLVGALNMHDLLIAKVV